MPKAWHFLPHDEARVRELTSRLKISPLVAQVVLARGLDDWEDIAQFLRPKLDDLHEPDLLPGVPIAADGVVAAIQQKRRITIYGDYDVDGMTATSLLWYCCRMAGAEVDYYIPHRLEEGYGLNSDAIRKLYEDDPNRLVITVDCGIASVVEAELARELGLELIITDHHELAERLPVAAAVVHPRLPGSAYPFGDLCGAGVAFKLAWAICQRMGDGKKASPRMREFLKSAVGLAAIGTIADVVPLLGENRVLVRYGLATLQELAPLGLKALLQIARLNGNKVITEEDVGFGISPRLNAAGRLGQARLAVELLTTENAERALALAEYLDQLNKNRQVLERKIFKQAKELVEEHAAWQAQSALVLAQTDWHAGVIGIVANRVAEHFCKPAILIALDHAKQQAQGSGRSYNGFDLHAGLSACSEHLATFGGHQAAAGLRVEPDRIDAFRDQFVNFVALHQGEHLTDEQLRIDAEVALSEVNWQTVQELNHLGPFGQGHPRPQFAASNVELVGEPRKMGGGDRHLSLTVRQHRSLFRAVAFGKGEWAEELAQTNGKLSICFAPIINEFRGQSSVELRLIDWQLAE